MKSNDIALGDMTLRDHFAAEAMSGWLATFGPDNTHPATNHHHPDASFNIAEASYIIADAMLAARKPRIKDTHVDSEPDPFSLVLFVGGTLEGMQPMKTLPRYIDHESEQYHRYDIEIDGVLVKVFYVWSGLTKEAASQSVDIVFGKKQ
jgi:hypothetical protein